MTDSFRALSDTGKRLRSAHVKSTGEVVGNRLVSGTSTIAVGGSIAAIVTYYLQPPETLHAHIVSLVIFTWQSAVFLVGFFWRRKSGGWRRKVRGIMGR